MTTKKGSKDEAGTAHVTYDGAFNANFVKAPIAVLTPEEWVRSRRGTDYGARTDWYNALLRDFSYGHSHYVGVDGSTAKGSYNASVSYKNSLGVDLVDAREEFGARAAVEQRLIKDYLQLNISLNARRVNEEYGNDGSFGTALTINPTFPIYNDDGSYYQPTAPTGATNPVEAMLNKTANGQRLYTTGAVSLKANFIKTDVHNLSSTVTYSLDYNDYKSNNYTPIESHDKYWNGYEGTASLSYSKNWRNQLEWLFNYSFHQGAHHLNAVAGYSYQDHNSESMNMTNRGFTYDSLLWNDIGAGTARTDWYNALLRDFSYGHSHYVGVDGSTAKGSYNASVSYKNSLGVDLVDAREEFGARAAVEQRLIKDILQLNISLNARRVNEEYGNDGSFGTALTINPTFPIYNEDGSYYQPTAPTGATNPVEAMLNKTANGQRLYTTGAVSLKANFIKNEVHNLSSTVTYSLDYNDYKSNNYTPIESHDKYWNGYEGTASLSYSKNWRNQLEWLFNYSFHQGAHHLNAVAGYSYQDHNSESMNMTNRGFTYDSLLWNDIGAGTARTENPAQTGMGSGKSLSKVIALLGRVNYNWNNTIFASLSLRHEGATNFGANHKWGNFPAASLAWEMANMEFMQGARWINSLKPRVSYGVTGRRGGSNVSRPTYGSHGQYRPTAAMASISWTVSG